MTQVNCYRRESNRIQWAHGDHGVVAQRNLFRSAAVDLWEYQMAACATWSIVARKLYLVTAGELRVGGGEALLSGDLYWFTGSDEPCVAGKDGVTFYAINPQLEIGTDMASQQITSGQLPWQEFEDPAGRPTQPVQVLLEGSLSALRTRFKPTYIAGEHWHDFDTLYFITAGRMQFGDEGWFETGDIRAVHGGHSYGPERPGNEGVEFVLISLCGPVALHWSDLEPPP